MMPKSQFKSSRSTGPLNFGLSLLLHMFQPSCFRSHVLCLKTTTARTLQAIQMVILLTQNTLNCTLRQLLH